MERSQKLKAVILQTSYFQNNGDHFEMRRLPMPFQYAPVFALAAIDVNGDKNLDIVSGGNLSATRARTGKLTGNYGTVGYGNGMGDFAVAPPAETGLCLKGDVRHFVYDNGKLIVGINDGKVEVYSVGVRSLLK